MYIINYFVGNHLTLQNILTLEGDVLKDRLWVFHPSACIKIYDSPTLYDKYYVNIIMTNAFVIWICDK